MPVSIDKLTIEQFAKHLKQQGRQSATIESYSRDASRFLEYLKQMKIEWDQVSSETLSEFQSYLAEREKGNSIRRTVIGVRQFYRFLSDLGHMSDSPLDEATIPGRDDRLPEKPEGLEAVALSLLANADNLIAARNAAILSLLAFEGIKATELIALEWSDFLSDGKNPSLRIPGTKSRTIFLNSNTIEALTIYRSFFRSFTDKKTKMFISFKGRDASVTIPHMTRHGLKFILYEIGERFGLSKLNTELLRHHAVEHMLNSARTPEEVMNHLGLRRLGNIGKHATKRSRLEAE